MHKKTHSKPLTHKHITGAAKFSTQKKKKKRKSKSLGLTAAVVYKSSFLSNSVLTDLDSTMNWMHGICCTQKSALHYKWVHQAWTIATWVWIVKQEYSGHKCICINIHFALWANFLLEVSHLMSHYQKKKKCIQKQSFFMYTDSSCVIVIGRLSL